MIGRNREQGSSANELLGQIQTPNISFLDHPIAVGEVQNLTATLQPNYESGPEPSVALQWEAPRDVREDEVITYDIRFKPKDSDIYSEKSVDGPNKSITFTKATGLQPLKLYKFEVRARIGDTAGKWKVVSQYTGK